MTRASLRRVLGAFTSCRADPQWAAAHVSICAQRQLILDKMERRSAWSVYGFTTLLGQLDNQELGSVKQTQLLEGHLQGHQFSMPGDFIKLLSASKSEQLSHGGSGVSGRTFAALLESLTADPPIHDGAWLDSYGSGDVVPGAWWAQSLLADGVLDEFETGDVIALISGNFVSTSAAIIFAAQFTDLIARFLVSAAEHCDLPPVTAPWPLNGAGEARILSLLAAHTTAQARDLNGPQIPVSLRDICIYVHPLLVAVDALGEAIDWRLSRSSANPLFSVDPRDDIVAASQSGFLDIALTLALTNCVQTIHLIVGACQRMVVHRSRRELQKSPVPRWVQPPKIVSAMIEQASSLGGQLPNRFVGADSDGLEDARDLSLQTAASGMRLIEIANDAMVMLTDEIASEGNNPGLADSLREALRQTLTDSDADHVVDQSWERLSGLGSSLALAGRH